MSVPPIVERYRHLRDIAAEIQDAALDLVTEATLVEFGRRLGGVQSGCISLEDEAELNLLYDLAIHTARPGRSRALDRYARSATFAPGSDHACVLKALQDARLLAFRIEQPHPAAGAIACELLQPEPFHLMDIAVGVSASPGQVFIARLADIEGFRMSCLTMVPADQALMEAMAMRMLPHVAAGKADAQQEVRFATAVYRSAIELGTLRRCVIFDPANELPTRRQLAAMQTVSDRRSAGSQPPMGAD